MFGDAMSIFARSTSAPSGKLAGAHAPKQREVFGGRALAIGLVVPGR